MLNGKGRGLTLAMVHFLDDECGIRWWSEYEEFVPTGDLALGPLDRRGRPAFARRDIYVTPKGRKNALRFASYSMLNANGDSKYGAVNRYGTGGNCHTFGRYLPAEKHFKEHPEWFIMSESGKRTAAPACMSSPRARVPGLRLDVVEPRFPPRSDIRRSDQSDGFRGKGAVGRGQQKARSSVRCRGVRQHRQARLGIDED